MVRNTIQSDTRRTLLKASLAVLALGVSGFVQRALAAADDAIGPKDAFAKKNDADTIKLLYGKDAEASDAIKLDAPEIAENGAVVPVSVSTTLPNVTSISILVSENPSPLAASYKIPTGTSPTVANRIKMAKTSKVVALVESNGKIFSANKEVKVTVGGCGG
jgi:sulfur-oxidizing protein SoxY